MNIKLLKDLNFADKINATNAITEAGKEMLNNYRSYVYSNAASCGLVNSFIREAQSFSFDAGLVSILESVLSFVNENKISWELGSACESLANNNSPYGYIGKLGIEQAQKLLEMNESEVVSYLKAGALKGYQYIPEFRNICREVFKSTVNEVHNTNYTVTNPISFVRVNENNEQFFKVLGKTYKIAEGKIEEAVNNDTVFNRVNALLESFTQDGEKIYYDYKGIHGDSARFTISENGLEFTKGASINEKFTTPAEFTQYCNVASKVMQMQEKMNWMAVTSAIAEVFEAMDSVVSMDCVKLMNCADGTVCAVIEGKDNVNLTVFRSVHNGTSCKSYDYVSEALKEVTKMTGIDLRFMYESRIAEDLKKQDPENVKEIEEQLAANKESQLSIRKKKIAMLAEQYKNDPARITLLNKVAKELALLEEE